MITEADLAAAWASGYWHGTSHTGPLNDAVVAQKNPYKVTAPAAGVTTPAKACKVALKTQAPDPEPLAPDSPTD